MAEEKWRMIRPFFFILALHCLAVFLYTRGFLLTRTELSSFSRCSDDHPCSAPLNSTAHSDPFQRPDRDHDQWCWTRPAVDRIVIIVLDALRYDFLSPSTFFKEKKPWMDKLTVLQRLAAKEPLSARIFKAIADPPTTSLQRLKGLTTGGLPTFIDVGNSFGAPAIVEDNLIHQMAQNGKRVLMMGDDTWLQLFPNHFKTAYPYPSFNVKDLDTVDNGVVKHLFPSLYQDDWDVLIAHFLGVDHAGHIFGVDSMPMVQKLEQYNSILERVVEVLKNQSGPGGLHENTLLIVMGDHGQTLNGDHGGGTAEEVETSLFAMSLRSPPPSVSSILDHSTCKLDLEGEMICTSSMQQLDFATTLAALLGIPFPFGSIGCVNPELYALSGGTWDGQWTKNRNQEYCSDLEEWMQTYTNVLCINSWQVNRYIDMYTSTAVIGLPSEDLRHLRELYTQAQTNLQNSISSTCSESTLQRQIDAYSDYLGSVAKLARSAWTEFNLILMFAGLCVMILSIFVQIFFILRVNNLLELNYLVSGITSSPFRLASALALVVIRAASFLSNSYILEEGRVGCFLLGTTGILNLWSSIRRGKLTIEEPAFLFLNIILRFGIMIGQSKKNVGSTSMDAHLYAFNISLDVRKQFLAIPMALQDLGKNFAPRIIYAIGFGLLTLIMLCKNLNQKEQPSSPAEQTTTATVAMLCAWSPTVLILLGSQGPPVALIYLFGAWCIIRSHRGVQMEAQSQKEVLVNDPISITQWSLLGVCLFFYTGHWCTFDGLRYGAAFVGFDEFNIVRQGLLLAIDTFGVLHIIPVMSLPLLVTLKHCYSKHSQVKAVLFLVLTQLFLSYGLITAVTTTFTIVCVTIQRRHLMVWGLFAPKYVFEVLGLLLTDILICLASLCYY
ncbi:LOW QUALITY PROTEIN: GPI ethanolamine phosphate transferase 3-like [Dioscorea cayenensis subsp. rotundata]|uniref:LOW QUALITY PROTEIN: GPI ethanolamine phosphate transferase 3-like n=1 Tax=Dioscorea cayennensis subsp. rotundata TaxID=55577 RepID=A0AB40D7M8_DIOCR|nr:LOW QUALITY PROTEIN: GPI ethanolamine phosphate transferase 3-like [Dioscorea cayenensis subsp. rotundata]